MEQLKNIIVRNGMKVMTTIRSVKDGNEASDVFAEMYKANSKLDNHVVLDMNATEISKIVARMVYILDIHNDNKLSFSSRHRQNILRYCSRYQLVCVYVSGSFSVERSLSLPVRRFCKSTCHYVYFVPGI